MSLRRRAAALLGGVTAVGFGAAGYYRLTTTTCDEIACFAFAYRGADDAPSRLDIEHTGGERQLPAGDVYITNVSVDYESGATDTVAWAELDDGIGPTDAINGEARRVNLGSVGIVQILWQQDDVERVIEAWVFDDDVS